MAKIIVDNRTDLDWYTVLNIVNTVISEGRISNYGKQYCYASTFEVDGKSVMVVTDLNKNSDRFVIQYC